MIASLRQTISAKRAGPPVDPLWYKQAVIYELHVRAFYDSDGSGVGDFRGLTQKLDYLKDLGVTALWLLPFYPSPLKDDGYDISDYYNVHPQYGTLADFKVFLREAHRRQLRVITELVMNHTSDQHPWFQRARRATPGSRWWNYYVWSDTPDKYLKARIIFKDVELSNWTWDPVAQAYFWHRFFSHQPDLNYDNPEVFAEMMKVLDFWLDLGVDGVRLDAVPYLYEREGSSCENLPETHQALKRLRRHVDEKYGDRMLLGEANQWPEDAAAYFGEGPGDECHMAFHFPLMPRLFMALRMEDRTPIVDILEQTPPIPKTAQWALFLRNHDELTLEMVTDEERDYMYRTYAQVHQARLNLGIRRRLAPLLGNDRKRIELLNALLVSLPGTPVIYYGDEIGMGENIFLGDRNGVRTPMQWSADKNAGFSRANPQSLYLPIIYDPEYHYEANNVDGQLRNPHSLLWWMRRLLALRKRWRALGEGQCKFLHPENRKILAYTLTHGDERLLVVANLSRFVQPVELDLAAYRDCQPVELFGRVEFPAIGARPYFLTLSPHAFFLFSLERRAHYAARVAGSEVPLRTCAVAGDWTAVLGSGTRSEFETILAEWLQRQGWFEDKGGPAARATIREAALLPLDTDTVAYVFLEVAPATGDPKLYAVPLMFAAAEAADAIRQKSPQAVVCQLTVPDQKQSGLLHDALASETFGVTLLRIIASRSRLRSDSGTLTATRTPIFREALGENPLPAPVVAMAANQSSVMYGDKFILKFFRRLEPGENPEFEISQFLSAHAFPYAQQPAGAVEWWPRNGDRLTLGVLNRLIPGAKDAWIHTLDALGRYYDRVAAVVAESPGPLGRPPTLKNWIVEECPAALSDLVGAYRGVIALLGERTAELHLALAAAPEEPNFAPEPFTPHYARGLFQSFRNQARQSLERLRQQLPALPEDVALLAQRVVDLEPEIIRHYRAIYERPFEAQRIRCHGNFNLGRVLYTGKDFVISNFADDPAIPLSERRFKRSPLRDVVGLVRSLDYVAWAGLEEHLKRGGLDRETRPKFEPWVRFWYQAVSSDYLRAYFQKLGPTDLLPRAPEDRLVMLRAYWLNQAVSELGDALNHRPAGLRIALEEILRLLEADR